MNGLVEVVESELLWWEFQVAIFVYPYVNALACDDSEKELTNVELGVVDEQRQLDVLLNDVLVLTVSQDMLENARAIFDQNHAVSSATIYRF